MKFSPYTDGERLYGNIADSEINPRRKKQAPLHAEWLDRAIERSEQKAIKPIGEKQDGNRNTEK